MLDLFAGIGVASLAAETVWPGIEHEFVEINPYSQTILKKHFPNSLIHGDIKQFHPTGTVDIVWGSPPCQAASAAGKRKGTADDRWLWPEYFRVIAEAKPKWTIAENVYGLLSLNGGLDFEELCTGLEKLGYEVRTFVIPALAVGAPHERNRVWIIAHRISTGTRSESGAVGDEGRTTSTSGRARVRQTHREVSASRPKPTDSYDSTLTAHSNNDQSRNEQGEISKENGIPKVSGREMESRESGGTSADDLADSKHFRSPQCKSQERSRSKKRLFKGNNSDTTHTSSERLERKKWELPKGNQRCCGNAGNSDHKGLQGHGKYGERARERTFRPSDWEEDWRDVAARTCVRPLDARIAKRLFRLADGSTISAARKRTEDLKALGNSLVYPLVVKLFEAIKYSDQCAISQ